MKLILEGKEYYFTTMKELEDFIQLTSKGPVYNSSTHGPILIKDMADNHIRNAIAKRVHIYFDNFNKIANNSEFLDKLFSLDKDDEIYNLVEELQKRVSAAAILKLRT